MGLPSWFCAQGDPGEVVEWQRTPVDSLGREVPRTDTGGPTEQMSGKPVHKLGSLSTRQWPLSTVPSLWEDAYQEP